MATDFMLMTNRAIFLDRDGTINEEVGHIITPERFKLFSFAAEAVRLINRAEWRAIVVTNQSGVARGHFTEEFLRQIHGLMEDSLRAQDARLDAIYSCVHHPEFGCPPMRCDCRKPRPGLIERAAKDFDLGLDECFVVGDRYRDVEAGHAAGASGVLVMTGFGREEYEVGRERWLRQPEFVAENLLEAVRWILNQSEAGKA
jgi:D-glycero-D-manno-heptose 1,7-bisphosphate phosphatase